MNVATLLQPLGRIADQEARVVFRGPPAGLVGELWLDNSDSHDSHAVVATLIAPADVSPRLTLSGRASLRARLRPGERRLVTMRVSLDPLTPPGHYAAEVELRADTGETRRLPALVVVTPVDDLEVTPTQLVFTAGAGARLKGELVLANRGNVPVRVGELGRFPLEDDRLFCRISRRAMGDLEPAAKAFDVYLRQAVDKAHEVLEELGFVRIRNPVTEVQPGEVELLPLDLILPRTLPATGHFFATARVHNRPFTIEVVTLAGAVPRPPQRDEAKRARSPR